MSSSYEENYMRRITNFANRVDADFDNDEDSWLERFPDTIDNIANTYRKSPGQVVSDLIDERNILVRNQREEDEVRYLDQNDQPKEYP